jgi:dGTPase
LREAAGRKSEKFGAYHSEGKEFKFARELSAANEIKSIEAELMDWADDITYAVHDIEDFYRAGLIPLGELAYNKDERRRFLERTRERWTHQEREEVKHFGDYEAAFDGLMEVFPADRPYTGSASQRGAFNSMTSVLIGDFVRAISLHVPSSKSTRAVVIKSDKLVESKILKELTWHYVILSPALATQQHGYREVIRGLFKVYTTAITDRHIEIIPTWFKFDVKAAQKQKDDKQTARTAADIVSSLTDIQALMYYRRLMGVSPGSLRDWI